MIDNCSIEATNRIGKTNPSKSIFTVKTVDAVNRNDVICCAFDT